MIGIIDYGRGNLRSVENALHQIGQSYVVSSDPDVLRKSDKLILPGVGAFKDCMENIRKKNLYTFIKEEAEAGKPLLGICLGMQMLFEESEEMGYTEGFGFMKGRIRYINDETVPIPQIGWNELVFQQDHILKNKLSEHPFVYYVHSYYADEMNDEDLIAYSEYGSVKVPGLVIRNNVAGCQFHPEKSADDGLQILKWFTEEFS